MSADEIWNQLQSIVKMGQFKKIEKLASQFDDEAMYGDKYPEEYFEVILKILTDSKMQKVENVFIFLLMLSPDAERLTDHQRTRLFDAIVSSLDKFTDGMLVHGSVDFICRHYGRDEIVKLLSGLLLTNIPEKQSYLEMGLNIAMSKNKLSQDDVNKLLKQMPAN